jgi:hypothetical protein
MTKLLGPSQFILVDALRVIDLEARLDQSRLRVMELEAELEQLRACLELQEAEA